MSTYEVGDLQNGVLEIFSSLDAALKAMDFLIEEGTKLNLEFGCSSQEEARKAAESFYFLRAAA